MGVEEIPTASYSFQPMTAGELMAIRTSLTLKDVRGKLMRKTLESG